MLSLQTVVRFIVNYIPYGKEIESSVKGPYFYNDQVYRDEEDSREFDLEKGIVDNKLCNNSESTDNVKDFDIDTTTLQVVSYY